MEKLPAFPAGSIGPFARPSLPVDWKPSASLPYFVKGGVRHVPMFLVGYQAWWYGRNTVSRHFTGKDSHAVGGVPSTLQGYIAAGVSFYAARSVIANTLQWQKWNIAPPQPWAWDWWSWHKAGRPARWARGAVKVGALFVLGLIKAGVDKIEIDRRIRHKDMLKVARDAAQKLKAEETAKAAAVKAKADAEAAAKKAERKAARKAEKAAAKAKAAPDA